MADNKFINILKEYPLAIICLVVIAVSGGLIYLRADKADEFSIQEDELNTRIRVIDKNLKSSKGIDTELSELNVLVEQVEARLFDKSQLADNLKFFYDLEKRMGVLISNITQSANQEAIYAKKGLRELKLYSTLTYNISLKGSYQQILSFLFELHRVEQLIRVADFRLSSSSAEESQLDCRLRIIVLGEK